MVYERFLNVQASKQRGKNLAVGWSGAPGGGGGGWHGTTGTVVNLTLSSSSSNYCSPCQQQDNTGPHTTVTSKLLDFMFDTALHTAGESIQRRLCMQTEDHDVFTVALACKVSKNVSVGLELLGLGLGPEILGLDLVLSLT